MHLKRAEWAGLGLAALAAAVPVFAWDHIPSSVAVWWGLGALPDIEVPKPWGPFILPAISAAICVSTLVEARRGNERTRAAVASAAGRTAQLAVQACLLVLTLAPLLVGAGLAESVGGVAMFTVGVLLVVAGNVQGKLRRNPFWGTRTPWSLGSDEVWLRTQRLAGWLMTLSGMALLVAAAAGRGFTAAVAALVISVIAIVVYSFLVHRRIAGSSSGKRA